MVPNARRALGALLLVGAVVLVVCALSTPVSLGAAPAPAAQAPVGVITLPPPTPTTPQPAIATPLGVRPAGADGHDHARVLTPGEAVERGADYLVVGRPITESPDPGAAARAILREVR